MSGQDPPPDAAHLRCRNCEHVLTGHFCANCGQPADVHVPTTREVIHEVLEGVTHSDSRLWQTLKMLWFKPGSLTVEFIAGRRAAFLPPFRLYLILSVIFFLTASLVHVNFEVIHFDDTELRGRTPEETCRTGQIEVFGSHRFDERFRHACQTIVRDGGASLVHVAIGTMPKAMFIFLPLIAFLHMVMYWRPRHRYVEHLLFFIHVHAFFFSAITVVTLASNAGAAWPKVGGATGILVAAVLCTLPLYTLVAMRRVFRRGWISLFFKALALIFWYSVILGITIAVVFFYAMFQL